MLFVLLLSLSELVCCKPYNLYQEYSNTRIITEKGLFSIGFEPEPRLEEVEGKEIEVWTSPYRFSNLYVPKNNTVLYGEVYNLKIESVETGVLVYSNVYAEDSYRRSNLIRLQKLAKRQKVRLLFGFGLLEIPYHDYKITFDYKIYKNENTIFEQGKIEAVVKTDFYKAARRKKVGIL